MKILPDPSQRLGRLRMDRVFREYEHPALFSAVDDMNHRFLALSIEVEPDGELFLYVPQSDRRLIATATGAITLRQAFAFPESPSVFLVRPHMADERSIIEISREQINEAWLPDGDVRLNEPVEASSPFSLELLQDMARSQLRSMTAIELDQSAASNRHQLPVRKASAILGEYQELKDVLATELASGRSSAEAELDSEECLVLLAAASVVFVMAPYVPDGRLTAVESGTTRALHDVLGAASDADQFITRLGSYSKRTVVHIRDFLSSLSDSGTGLTFHSASSGGQTQSSSLALPQVRHGLDTLALRSVLPPEVIRLTGNLVGIQHLKGTFSVRESTATGNRRQPRTMNGVIDGALLGSGRLEGVATGLHATTYRFVIQKETTFSEVTGQPDRNKLRLVDFEPT